MVTHGAPGDTFWDIIRKGAQSAASKDNVDFKYSSDPDSGKQATLIQSAIDSKVDDIAVTLPDPPAIAPAVKKAIAAGIPVVAFNAGVGDYAESGAMSYFGSDEGLAGQSGGKRASDDGFKHLLCVVQFQGQVQLESRCSGAIRRSRVSTTRSRQRFGPALGPEHDRGKLKQDPSIDFVLTLGAPIALNAIDAIKDTGRARRSARSIQPADPAEDRVR